MATTDIQKILIATAWPYVNGDIHIGHLPGYFVPGDITARYFRMRGADVVFVSGTDCHGTPITVEADKKGLKPIDIVNEYDPKVRELIEFYDFSFDNFTTTTTANHKEVSQKLFLDLLKNGFIIKQKSEQYYSETDQKFLPDRYVEGECPYCHSQDQRSDQCENCGRSLGLGELINPKSKLTKSEVTLKETEHYFIDFPKLQPEIEKFVNERKDIWKDWVWSEAMGWIKEGLEPRAITRDLDWGIEIPKDQIPEELRIENMEFKRFYVWFEAVIGYLSATIEFCKNNNKDYSDFWHNQDSRHYYFMGQDNLTFHTIFWPGQLIGSRQDYTLPHDVSVVKFLNANGAKLSKSRGNIIDAKVVGEFFGPEIVKFYITSIMPENKSSNWDWQHFKDTINSELVGNLGNFIHRVLTFSTRLKWENIENSSFDSEVETAIKTALEEVSKDIENTKFISALENILKLSRFGNQYFDKNKPWADPDNSHVTIYNCLQIILALRIVLYPFLPSSMDQLSEYLGIEKLSTKEGEDLFRFETNDLQNCKISKQVKPLFKKIEPEDLEKFVESQKKSEPIEISKEKYQQLLKEIKLVKILSIDKHPNADKLVITQVSDGKETYQVVTGATNVKVGDIVPYLGINKVIPGFYLFQGEEVMLEKKALRGVDSYGMILAEDEIGLSEDHEDVVVYELGDEWIGKSIIELDTSKID